MCRESFEVQGKFPSQCLIGWDFVSSVKPPCMTEAIHFPVRTVFAPSNRVGAAVACMSYRNGPQLRADPYASTFTFRKNPSEMPQPLLRRLFSQWGNSLAHDLFGGKCTRAQGLHPDERSCIGKPPECCPGARPTLKRRRRELPAKLQKLSILYK